MVSCIVSAFCGSQQARHYTLTSPKSYFSPAAWRHQSTAPLSRRCRLPSAPPVSSFPTDANANVHPPTEHDRRKRPRTSGNVIAGERARGIMWIHHWDVEEDILHQHTKTSMTKMVMSMRLTIQWMRPTPPVQSKSKRTTGNGAEGNVAGIGLLPARPFRIHPWLNDLDEIGVIDDD